MVQLNPFKRARNNKKKLRIEEIKSSLKKNTRTQGGAGIRRNKLKQELTSLGGKTDAQKLKEDKAARAKYTKDNRIVNRRGRTTGFKEGYDPSKGVQKPNTKTSTTKAKNEKKKQEKKKRKLYGAMGRGIRK